MFFSSSSFLRLIICVFFVVATLWFGWYPFNFFPDNDVSVNTGTGRASFGMGLQGNRFDNRGMAWTVRPVTFDNNKGAVFHFILTPLKKPEGLGCILVLYDGDSQPPFVIAQWQTHLVLFRRELSLPKGYREVGLRDLLPTGRTVALTIRTRPGMTEVFAGGKLMGRYPGFSLLGDEKVTGGRLIIGNNAEGTEAWRGSIRRVVLYGFYADPILSDVSAGSPVIDYDFRTYKDEIVVNRNNPACNLVVPGRFSPPARTFFSPMVANMFERKNTYKDIILNIIGFMPVSFCFSMLSRKLCHRAWLRFFFIVVMAFLFSFLIESVQVLLPSRNSSQLDLLCNTFGGMLAAFSVVAGNRRPAG